MLMFRSNVAPQELVCRLLISDWFVPVRALRSGGPTNRKGQQQPAADRKEQPFCGRRQRGLQLRSAPLFNESCIRKGHLVKKPNSLLSVQELDVRRFNREDTGRFASDGVNALQYKTRTQRIRFLTS